jgi:hypothetical protein
MKTAQITIKFRENGLTFFYSKAFQNAVIIGMKFLKSGEWIYPIYRTDNNEKLSGYIYEGDVLTFSQIAEILQKFTPPFLKDFTDFQKRFAGRIEYFKTKTEELQVIGKYSDREIIVKKN